MEANPTIALPDLHSGGQYQAFASPARFKIMVCGRRWGKSLLAAVALIVCALKGGKAWWVWPSFPMAMTGWRRLLDMLQPLVSAKLVKVLKQERMFVFPGGGSIQMKSAERANSLRGEGLDLVVIDEWAYIRYGRKIWESDLRPALAERMGKAILVTTPNGMDHVFEYYNAKKNDPEYACFKFPTWTNPFIPKAEIEAARRDLPPGIFSQEYGAEFEESAEVYFQNIQRVMKAEIQQEAAADHVYRLGLDIGRYRDRSVAGIIDMSMKPMELCWVEVMEEWNFVMQKNRVLTLAEKYDIDLGEFDVTGMGIGLGERIEEEASFSVMPTTYTNTTKMNMFEDLYAAYENDELLIPDLEWLKIEHQMIKPQIVPGRLTVKLEARAGFFDDGVNMCALAQKATKRPRVSLFAR